MTKPVRFILPLALSLLSACGFHLRGAIALPTELTSMRLECPTAQERVFCQALERQLEANGVRLSEARPNYILTIEEVQANRRAVSIDERAVAREIELTLTADFVLIDANDITILPSTPVSALQSYRNDQAQILGKGREEQQVRRDLSQQLSMQIMSRLAPLTQQRIDTIRREEAARAAAAEQANESLQEPL